MQEMSQASKQNERASNVRCEMVSTEICCQWGGCSECVVECKYLGCIINDYAECIVMVNYRAKPFVHS